ncbi:hypothetical protein HHI36_018708 [Cryptolaemus montrouzieri]|uniref:Uncharacterized protein n=1 Tax=Cryptolaemus montrouzieri TaxID=559131 RepID=A0ABD2P0Q8_9CUCU
MGLLEKRPQGEIVEQWLAQVRMEMKNSGTPTLIRYNSESAIDLTLCSSRMAGRVEGWRPVPEIHGGDGSDPPPTAEIEPFTLEELYSSARSMQNKKAPGPDGMAPESVKLVIDTLPMETLEMFNELLKTQVSRQVKKKLM